MCSRNTVKESSHISFFFGRDLFRAVGQRPKNTHGELTSLLEWPAGLSSPLERPADPHFPWAHNKSLPSVQHYRPYIVFSSPTRKYEHPLRLTYFLFMAGYRNLHTSVFFGNLIFSANGNICHSIHRQWIIFSPWYFIVLFPVKTPCQVRRRKLS